MTGRLDIRLVQDTDLLRVWLYKGQSDRLCVSFNGIGPNTGELNYEFANTATQRGRDHALFIADKTRSWLNSPGLIEEIVQWITAFKAETGAQNVMTLGHSMGGFTALAMPKFLPVKVAVALSPQVSVHPDVVGDDPRWMRQRREIREFRLRSVQDMFVDDTAYYIMHGRHPREAPQRDRFPRAKNIHHYVLPNTVHNVPQKLRGAGILEEVVEYAFQNRPRKTRLAMSGLEAYRRPEDENLPDSSRLAAAK